MQLSSTLGLSSALAEDLKAPSCSILPENHVQAQIYKQNLQEEKAAWLDSFGMAIKIPGVDAH